MRELAEYLVESGLRIVQMPCPELAYLGLDRQVDHRLAATTVESEGTRVAFRMRDSGAALACNRLVEGCRLSRVGERRPFHGSDICHRRQGSREGNSRDVVLRARASVSAVSSLAGYLPAMVDIAPVE